MPVEGYLLKNFVHGAFVSKSTTGSSQLTGAGNGTFIFDIAPGIVVVDGTQHEVALAADVACEAAGDIIADTYSIVYTIIVWKHPTTGALTFKVHKGTVALSAAVVPATVAEVEAGLPAGAKYVELANYTIARTAATTVTEAVDNTIRPKGYAV
jgi:hypothetical protein